MPLRHIPLVDNASLTIQNALRRKSRKQSILVIYVRKAKTMENTMGHECIRRDADDRLAQPPRHESLPLLRRCPRVEALGQRPQQDPRCPGPPHQRVALPGRVHQDGSPPRSWTSRPRRHAVHRQSVAPHAVKARAPKGCRNPVGPPLDEYVYSWQWRTNCKAVGKSLWLQLGRRSRHDRVCSTPVPSCAAGHVQHIRNMCIAYT